MLWKLYFVFILISSLVSIPTLIASLPVWKFGDYRGIVELIISLLGVYQYVFGKTVFKKQVWVGVFWYLAIVWTLDLLYASGSQVVFSSVKFFFEVNSYPSNFETVLFSVLFALPMLYAIHKLAYSKK